MAVSYSGKVSHRLYIAQSLTPFHFLSDRWEWVLDCSPQDTWLVGNPNNTSLVILRWGPHIYSYIDVQQPNLRVEKNNDKIILKTFSLLCLKTAEIISFCLRTNEKLSRRNYTFELKRRNCSKPKYCMRFSNSLKSTRNCNLAWKSYARYDLEFQTSYKVSESYDFSIVCFTRNFRKKWVEKSILILILIVFVDGSTTS